MRAVILGAAVDQGRGRTEAVTAASNGGVEGSNKPSVWWRGASNSCAKYVVAESEQGQDASDLAPTSRRSLGRRSTTPASSSRHAQTRCPNGFMSCDTAHRQGSANLYLQHRRRNTGDSKF